MLRKILGRIKTDVVNLWRYPECAYGPDLGVDYSAYWKKRRHGTAATLTPWQKERADNVLTLIAPGSSIIDLGCGDGAVLKYLQDKAQIKGIGVDVNEMVLTQARELGIETLQLDLTDSKNLQKLPEADYITGFEILEHMPNPETFLFYASQRARKGVIFSVPNSGYYVHRLRLLFGKFPLQWVSHPGEHLRFWTVRDMKFWVRSIQFDLKKIVLYQGVLFLNKIWPALFAQGMIVFVQKNPPQNK